MDAKIIKLCMWVFLYTAVVTMLSTGCLAFISASSIEDMPQDVSLANQSIQQFTGDTMTSYIGWSLDGVYTAGKYNSSGIDKGNNVWVEGDDVSNAWFYQGDMIGGKYLYPNGITATQKQSVGDMTDRTQYSPIRLDPSNKSSIHLSAQNESIKYSLSDELSASDWLTHPFSSAIKTITNEQGVKNLYYWYFTGYRYQFSPVSAIELQSEALVTEDVKLNVIWYSNPDARYDESIEGGFLIYAEDVDGYVTYTDSLSMKDIINQYGDIGKTGASKYSFNFGGTTVYVFIKFDQGITNVMNVNQAFSNGYWSIQFASPILSVVPSDETGLGVSSANISLGEVMSTLSSILQPWQDNALIQAPFNWFLFAFITVPATLCMAYITLEVMGKVFQILPI